MSNLTMADVAQYFTAFQAKFGYPCNLSVDDIEQILMGVEDDDEAIIVNAMNDAMKPDEDEEDNSSESEVPAIETAEDGSPYSYSAKMDDAFDQHLEVLAEAALQNKRGAAVIMFDLHRLHGADTINMVWPEPGSNADNGRMIGNRLADKFKTVVKKEDGTSGEGEVSWIKEYVRTSPRGKKLYAAKESIRGVSAKETGPHILEEHKFLIGDNVKQKAYKSTAEQRITSANGAIARAVTLSQRMHLCNTKTTMGARISCDDDGSPVQSNKLVFVWNTEDPTKFDLLTVGQFLALKVEEGKKYNEIVGSTRRAPRKAEETKIDRTVSTLDVFDETAAAFATFFDKIEEQTARKEMKAYNALLTRLNAAGSDDLLLSLNKVMVNIDALLSKPGISDRLSKLLAGPADTKSKAA